MSDTTETDAVLSATLGSPHYPPSLPGTRESDARTIAITRVVDAAGETLPGARIAWIETPPREGGTFRLRLQAPGDPSRRFPHSYVEVDGTTGAVLDVFDTRGKGPSNVLKDWLHPLHDGSALGLIGRIIWTLIGLGPGALFVLGAMRWRTRRRSESQARSVRPRTSGES